MKPKKIVFLLSLFILAITLIRVIFKVHDPITLVGIAMTLGGLLFNYWQLSLSSEASLESKFVKIKEELNLEIRDIREDFNKRDFYHEQQLGLLNQYISEMRAHIESHRSLVGHPEMVKELLSIKDGVADLRAVVAAIGRQGEVILKLEKLQNEVDNIKSTT